MHHKRIHCDHCWHSFKNRKNLILHWIGFHGFDTFSKRQVQRGVPTLLPKEGKPHRKVMAVAHMARLKKEEAHANRKRIGAARARTPLPKALKISLRARNKFKRQQLKGS